MRTVSVCKTFTFAAAHYLPHHEGLCAKLHGHNYRLEVEVTGTVNQYDVPFEKRPPDTGMIIDFGSLKDVINEHVISQLDHTNLNDKYENPTAEIMVNQIYTVLKDRLWLQYKLHLKRIRLWETDTSWAQVEG